MFQDSADEMITRGGIVGLTLASNLVSGIPEGDRMGKTKVYRGGGGWNIPVTNKWGYVARVAEAGGLLQFTVPIAPR